MDIFCENNQQLSDVNYCHKKLNLRFYFVKKQSPGGVLINKTFWKFLKIYRKTHVPESLFSHSLRPATLLKERLWHRCFLVNFEKILRTPFLTGHLRWLLLFVLNTPLRYY